MKPVYCHLLLTGWPQLQACVPPAGHGSGAAGVGVRGFTAGLSCVFRGGDRVSGSCAVHEGMHGRFPASMQGGKHVD